MIRRSGNPCHPSVSQTAAHRPVLLLRRNSYFPRQYVYHLPPPQSFREPAMQGLYRNPCFPDVVRRCFSTTPPSRLPKLQAREPADFDLNGEDVGNGKVTKIEQFEPIIDDNIPFEIIMGSDLRDVSTVDLIRELSLRMKGMQ